MVAPQNLAETHLIQDERGIWVNRPGESIAFVHDEREGVYHITPAHERSPIAEGKRTLLLLGDSFAFGWLLSDDGAPHTLIQHGLDQAIGLGKWSVRNAATPGWGAGDYVAFLEDRYSAPAPDAVLVLLNVDDAARAGRSPHWRLSPSADTLSRVPVQRSAWRHRLNTSPAYQTVLTHSHLVQLTRSALQVVLSSSRAAEEAHGGREHSVGQAVRTTEALFERLASWGRAHDVPILVVTTGWHEPPYNVADGEPTRRFMARADSVFQSLGLPFYDSSPSVWGQRQIDPQAFAIAGDGHPNEAGARLMADGILPLLIPFLER